MRNTKSKSDKTALDYSLVNMGLAEIKEELTNMIKEKSLFNQDEVLPSGKITTHFLDLKETILSPRGAMLSSMAILHHLRDEVRAVGGSYDLAYSLAPCAAQLAYFRGQELDTFLVRDEHDARRYGHSKWIEGPLKPGADVCLVQDIAIDGLKIVETIRRLQDEADSRIIQFITIFDREDGAKLRLEDYGVDYTAIVTMKDIENLMEDQQPAYSRGPRSRK